MNKTFLFLVGAGLFCTNTMAAVNSISGEEFAQYGKDAYWVANVTCNEASDKRIIQRKADADEWCPKGADNLCDIDKALAAEKACSDEYNVLADQLVEEQRKQAEQAKQEQEAQAARKRDAERKKFEANKKASNKIALEEQMLSIEQQRLDLLQRELELDRRAAEIDALIEQASKK